MPNLHAQSLPPRVRPNQARVRAHASSGWSRIRAALRSFGAVLGRHGSYRLPEPYPCDAVLTEDSQFASLGLHPREAAAFQKLADHHAYEIFVRTGHVSRVTNVGRPGLRPKPAGVYQKTNKDVFAAGLVVYPEGEEAKARADLYAIRHPHPGHASHALRVLAGEGLRLRPLGQGMLGLRDGAGNFFYGDIDIHGVYRRGENGHVEPVGASTFVPLFNADLTATGLHAQDLLEAGTAMQPKDFGVLPHSPVQHGAHDEWSERNDASYAGGVNMGPLPGVIRFRPHARASHVTTVAHYRDIIASLGHRRVYTGEAWSNGVNRLATARYLRLYSSQSPGEALPMRF